MEAIKDTIQNVFKELVAKKAQSDSSLESWLKKILTKKELGHIKLQYFRKGVVGLNVDSSSWLYTFNLKKEGLLASLKDKSSAVKTIRFRIGEVK
ncbi:MAG: DciA family protein [Candidatus Omnitrophica bacterium]|nr:DciA family protein [Candidatus Omnitrophota bacterium]